MMYFCVPALCICAVSYPACEPQFSVCLCVYLICVRTCTLERVQCQAAVRVRANCLGAYMPSLDGSGHGKGLLTKLQYEGFSVLSLTCAVQQSHHVKLSSTRLDMILPPDCLTQESARKRKKAKQKVERTLYDGFGAFSLAFKAERQ